MVPGQQPLTQHQLDQEANCGLEKTRGRAHPHPNRWGCSGPGRELTWSSHTSTVVKKARQRLTTLTRLKRFGIAHQILRNFCMCTIESIPTGYMAWYGNRSTIDSKALKKGGADSPVRPWGQAPSHPRHSCQTVSVSDPKHFQSLHPPEPWAVFPAPAQ